MELGLHEFNWQFSAPIVIEVLVAAILGGLIGAEREVADKPAGWRTHMLVAGAAALLTSLSYLLVESFSDTAQETFIRTDPIRIVEAIITGVSFLGAGTIFRSDSRGVQGLTTAASLLFTASIGIAVALRELGLALCITLIAVLILRIVGWIERRSLKSSDAL